MVTINAFYKWVVAGSLVELVAVPRMGLWPT